MQSELMLVQTPKIHDLKEQQLALLLVQVDQANGANSALPLPLPLPLVVTGLN